MKIACNLRRFSNRNCAIDLESEIEKKRVIPESSGSLKITRKL